MIEWILIGEPSKANHRIYQVVLVFVCFEPHFIKFCDIMEVLAADSVCIMELRKSKQIRTCTYSYMDTYHMCMYVNETFYNYFYAYRSNSMAYIINTFLHLRSKGNTSVCVYIYIHIILHWLWNVNEIYTHLRVRISQYCIQIPFDTNCSLYRCIYTISIVGFSFIS